MKKPETLLPFDFVVLKNGRVTSRSIRFETRIWINGNELIWIYATSGVRCCNNIRARSDVVALKSGKAEGCVDFSSIFRKNLILIFPHLNMDMWPAGLFLKH